MPSDTQPSQPSQIRTPGTIALVGSGEYLDVMNETDSYLLSTVGGASSAKVALLPTASGLELGGPTSWNNLGLKHFKNLGVKDVRATRILDHDSAHDKEQLALLEGANFYYFSGGNPQYTIETMRNSPAWDIIFKAYQQGAVLAGCSAGAMMMGARTISMRQAMQSELAVFVEALSVVPNVIVFPHFDRMSGFLDDTRFKSLVRSASELYTVVGVDEDTALVRISLADGADVKAQWRVMGRQTVSIFDRDGTPQIFHKGDEVTL